MDDDQHMRQVTLQRMRHSTHEHMTPSPSQCCNCVKQSAHQRAEEQQQDPRHAQEVLSVVPSALLWPTNINGRMQRACGLEKMRAVSTVQRQGEEEEARDLRHHEEKEEEGKRARKASKESQEPRPTMKRSRRTEVEDDGGGSRTFGWHAWRRVDMLKRTAPEMQSSSTMCPNIIVCPCP